MQWGKEANSWGSRLSQGLSRNACSSEVSVPVWVGNPHAHGGVDSDLGHRHPLEASGSRDQLLAALCACCGQGTIRLLRACKATSRGAVGGPGASTMHCMLSCSLRWRHPTSEHRIWVQLLDFPCSSLLMHPGRQQKMAKVLEPLLLLWETGMEFLASGFGLALTWQL